MANCNCNCDPCRCRKPAPCVPCTSNTTTLPVCDTVNSCVRNDLQKTLADFGEPTIDNICAVTKKCVNEGLEDFIEGTTTGLNNFQEAIEVALKSLPGWSELGQKYITSVNGVIQWLTFGQATTTSTTTTVNPVSTTTTTMVLENIYSGAQISSVAPNEVSILSGDVTVADASNDVVLNWQPYNANPRYLWFAIPARTAQHNKNQFYFNSSLSGNIGGMSNLFGTPANVTINSLPYYLWMTNYATQVFDLGKLSKV